MTIIGTTLYADGALRLSRHGAGKGGNVLVHVETGAAFTIKDQLVDEVVQHIKGRLSGGQEPGRVFDAVRDRYEKHEVIAS